MLSLHIFCVTVCVCERERGPVIPVVSVSSQCIIMAVCVLYMTIKGISTLIVITVVHTGDMYDCAAVQRLHVHLLLPCVI